MNKRSKSLILAWLACILLALCASACADVGLMLNEALRIGASKWTGAGHSAVYLSNICSASPVELRPCLPGENGVVLTDYPDFGEDRLYQWNAVPFNIYLYGVEDESERSLYASGSLRWMLQERYRQKYLEGRCKGKCATNPDVLWREDVAVSFERDIYMFRVKTTPEQDRALVEKYNRAGNVGHYNGFSNNCADFVAQIVNTYFPGSARPDHVNDFWITSPKAIAKSFTHYAIKHPELEFRVIRYSQIPGEFKPSRDNRKGTEELYRGNRWRVPLAILRPQELLIFAGSYLISGRFNPELELQRRPAGEVIAAQSKLRLAQERHDRTAETECRQKVRAARSNALGTVEEWTGYTHALQQYEAEAIAQGYASDLDGLHSAAKRILARCWITADDRGGLWLSSRDGRSPMVGLSARTVAETSSDARVGYLLALSRVDAELRRKPKNRETLEFFRKDWELLEHLRGQVIPVMAGTRRTESSSGSAQ